MSKDHKEVGDSSWLNGLPEWSRLSSKDVLKLFGYASIHSLSSAMNKGIFPPADLKLVVGNGKGHARNYWTVATIKLEINRREKVKVLKEEIEKFNLKIKETKWN